MVIIIKDQIWYQGNKWVLIKNNYHGIDIIVVRKIVLFFYNFLCF